ncbi:MAG TPA: histone deacetylase [Tepidisphaeraceae bacterium]|jgi:acetoin utilization deacetylase AcuC-like enzyme|nr:histone deacetylase [Tepidisphaeraceae bacterium]
MPTPEPNRARVGYCSDACFVDHLTGPTHPERPDRIRAIALAVRQARLIDSPNPFPDFSLDLGAVDGGGRKLLELPPASNADNAVERWISAVHTPGHVERVRHSCQFGGVLDQGDTPVCPASYHTALRAVDTAINCCDAIVNGQVRRVFAAIRPPGHHAEPDRAMGFCLFCNIAIAARYLQRHHGLGKIAIVDFDVHHGNGTQEVFDADPSVLFISLHQDPRTCYPGTGYADEIGTGAGKGTTLNIPFQPGSGDDEYLVAMRERVLPALSAFGPEVLLVSAGFDGHQDDPLAQICLSDDGFAEISGLLAGAADELCGGRLLSLLEGGYKLRALGRSVVRHLNALSDRERP